MPRTYKAETRHCAVEDCTNTFETEQRGNRVRCDVHYVARTKKGQIRTISPEMLREEAARLINEQAVEFLKSQSSLPPVPERLFATRLEEMHFDTPQEGVALFCADEETEILSERGWLRYNEVREGDQVLVGVQKANGMFNRWERVQAVNRFQTVSPLMRVRAGRGYEALLTPDHRTLVNRHRVMRVVPAAEVRPFSDSLPVALPPETASGTGRVSPHFAALLGWYITDGHEVEGGVVISQSQKANPDFVDEIRSHLQALPALHWTEREPDATGKMTFYIADKPAAPGHGRRLVGKGLKGWAPDKHPDWSILALWSIEALRAMWEACVKADGTWHSRWKTFFQKDQQRADFFQALSARVGVDAAIQPSELGRGYLFRLTAAKLRGRVFRQVREAGYVPYTGTVWCPTTPSGTWYARRAGRVFVTGNSDLHYGSKVDRRVTAGLGEYNIDVARERLTRWRNGLLTFSMMDQVLLPLDTLHLFALGDDIEGHGKMFGSQAYQIQDSAAFQVLGFIEDTSRILLDLLARYAKIKVYKVHGNHGRIAASARDAYPPDNLEIMAWRNIADRIRPVTGGEWTKDKNGVEILEGGMIDFYISPSELMFVDILGWSFGIRHGHGIGSLSRTYTGALDNKRRLNAIVGEVLNYYCKAHLHQAESSENEINGETIQNSCFVGPSQLSLMSNMASANLPSQEFFLVHPRRGKTHSHRIYLADKTEIRQHRFIGRKS